MEALLQNNEFLKTVLNIEQVHGGDKVIWELGDL